MQISLIATFAAGLLSFFSPCVLPMLPTFSLMLAESADGNKDSCNVYLNSCCFLMGFTLIFLLMGATASLAGQYFMDYQEVLRKIGAVIIFIMGLTLTGIFSTSFLGRDFRPFLQHHFRGAFGSFVLGLAFTLGWTPCTGPILAAVLLCAGTASTIWLGSFYLLIYSLGFAVPFFFAVAVLRRYLPKLRNFYRFLPFIQKAAGYLFILLAVFLYFNWLNKAIGFMLSY